MAATERGQARPAGAGRVSAPAGTATGRTAREAAPASPLAPRPSGGSAQRRRAERAAGTGSPSARSRRGVGSVAVARASSVGRERRRASGAAARGARRTPQAPSGVGGRRRLNWRGRLLAVLGVLAVLGGAAAWVLLTAQSLTVREVRVTGAHRVAPAEVEAVAGRWRGEQLVGVDTAELSRTVEAMPLVAQVQVRRQWPDTLVVEVRERQAVAAVPSAGGGFLVVDAEGAQLMEADTVPPEVPLVVVDIATAGQETLRAALTVMGDLPAALRTQVADIGAASPESVLLTLRDGRTVLWGSAERSARKAEVLHALLAAEATRTAEHIDVSAPEHPAVRG